MVTAPALQPASTLVYMTQTNRTEIQRATALETLSAEDLAWLEEFLAEYAGPLTFLREN